MNEIVLSTSGCDLTEDQFDRIYAALSDAGFTVSASMDYGLTDTLFRGIYFLRDSAG